MSQQTLTVNKVLIECNLICVHQLHVFGLSIYLLRNQKYGKRNKNYFNEVVYCMEFILQWFARGLVQQKHRLLEFPIPFQ